MPDISTAVSALAPGAQFITYGDDVTWVDPPVAPVTDEQIADELARQLAEWEANKDKPPVPQIISDRQFFQQAANVGIISPSEALAAVKTGTIPTVLQNIINAEPDANRRFAMEMMISGATIFERNHPMTSPIGAALGLNEAEIDQFFIDAAKL